VVVAVARSREAEYLVAAGLAEAALRRTDLVVLHAWEPSDRACASGRLEEEAGWALRVEHSLAKAAAEIRNAYPGVAVRVEPRRQDTPAVLLDAVGEASLLVVGEQWSALPSAARLSAHAGSTLRATGCPIEVMPTQR